jgi:hypothetical protein
VSPSGFIPLRLHITCQTHLIPIQSIESGYDSFWTQWTVRTAEYSDIPMPRPPDEDTYYEFFKAKHTRRYLKDYVDVQTFAGQTLRDRIKLGIEVQSVQRDGKGWIFLPRERSGVEQQVLRLETNGCQWLDLRLKYAIAAKTRKIPWPNHSSVAHLLEFNHYLNVPRVWIIQSI